MPFNHSAKNGKKVYKASMPLVKSPGTDQENFELVLQIYSNFEQCNDHLNLTKGKWLNT